MALLNILVYPDSRLRTVAKPVEAVDSNIVTLVDDMAQTMYAAPGIGLAATQVNIPKRVIVMDVSETRDELMVFINPIIENQDGEIETEEGCLSVPGRRIISTGCFRTIVGLYPTRSRSSQW